MAKKTKYYTVWRGRRTGVFATWAECREAVEGFEGAQYKGFPTEEEAAAAHKRGYWECVGGAARERTVAEAGARPVVPSLSVDAACSGNPGLMEYRGVDTATGREIFRQGPFEDGTNNIGEFLALVHGLALMKKHGSDAPIYADSVTAMAWVRRKKCNSRLPRTMANVPIFDLIGRAEEWLAANTYTTQILKWPTGEWGEIPADFGRKNK